MKMTLLAMVQNILGSLDGDQVNSISDTTESIQVAEAIRTTYYNMLGRYDLPEHNKLIQLNPSGSALQPVLMLRPDSVQRIDWIKYFDSNPQDGTTVQDQYGAYSLHDVNTDLQQNANGWSTISTTSNVVSTGSVTFTVGAGLLINTGDSATAYIGIDSMSGTVTSYSGTTLILNITTKTGSGTFASWTIINSSTLPVGPGYLEVRVLPLEKFLHMVDQYDPTQSDVEAMELTVTDNNESGAPQTFTFYYKTDHQPQYCTILANYYIIFDSFDSTQDSTLQASKSMALAWFNPSFEMVDTFIPVLDDQQWPLFLNEAKSWAFYEQKQMPHQKAEQEVNRQVVSLQKWKAISGKPTYFEELPSFGRRGGGWC